MATEIAITMDDLPGQEFDRGDRMETVEKMLEAFGKHHLDGVYGMVNGKRGRDDVLRLWLQGRQLLANHSWSHPDLVKTSLPEFLDDIRANEPLLSELMGARNYRYFHYPFLAEGDTAAKREGVRRFLAENHYKVAQVTIDFFDVEWIEPYQRCLAKRAEADIQ